MSLNFPELQFPHLKKGDCVCLLELLHQLNEIIHNVLTLVSQQMVIFLFRQCIYSCTAVNIKFSVLSYVPYVALNVTLFSDLSLVGEQIGVMRLTMT